MALSLAVLRNGKPTQTIGADALYQTASLGKHFTAALSLLLGFDLDEPVAPHLPELPRTWDGLSLRRLLSHTAGIPAEGYESLDLERDYTDAEILSSIGQGGALEFPPGERWRYSNAGYVLAGIAIGRRTGRFYGDLLSELIFRPLGMTTAHVNGPDAPLGYVFEDNRYLPADYVSPTLNRLADGAITLSVLDLARWDEALRGPWGAQVAEMFQETRLRNGEPTGYGLGWSLNQSDRGRVAEHNGSWQGFSTGMVRYLDTGVTAIALANLADVDAIGLARALAGAASGQPST